MGANDLDEYWVPEHVKDYLRKLGFVLPLDDMEPWIRSWDGWMSARGDFYDYRDKDGMVFSASSPLSEASSLSTSSSSNVGDILTMKSEETYRIVTVCFDHEGNELAPVGVLPTYDTGCPDPTFGIVKPAVTNTRVDMSPYGQSVFADAVDAVQAVDLTFDALVNEVDLSKMRVFLSDVLFDRSTGGNKNVTIPFGKQDCTVFRKVMSTEDTIQEFVPALRTNAQIEAFRISLQMLGDLTGFGISYFDMDDSRGYAKTATEVSSSSSALMRNIRRHENSLECSIVSIARAVMHASRGFGENIPDEGITTVQFDDSIIQDTAAEKAQDMAEVGITLNPWEYRMRWLGEDETTVRARGYCSRVGQQGLWRLNRRRP